MNKLMMVEMVFKGDLGLEQWVQDLADVVEGVLGRHGVSWKRSFPVTLREALRLGLQQHVVGTHACPPGGWREPSVYRVWLALPSDGVSAWARELAGHIQGGCSLGALRQPALRKELEEVLKARLEPHLERANKGLIFGGQVYR